MKKSYCTIIIFCAALLACSTSQAQTTKDIPKDVETIKFIEKITGTWKLQTIVDLKQGSNSANKKATDETSNAYQMIEFGANARYKTHTGAHAVEEGSYRVNEEHAILYLESDSDDLTPSEWDISFKDNLMTMAGRGDNNAKRYKYIFTRTKDGVSTVD